MRISDWSSDVCSSDLAQRAKKYVSLNEAERRAERDRQEAKRKSRQEQRKELGLPLDPLAADAADDGLQANERNVVADAAREKAAEAAPDPLLRESARLLADAVQLPNHDTVLTAHALPGATEEERKGSAEGKRGTVRVKPGGG